MPLNKKRAPSIALSLKAIAWAFLCLFLGAIVAQASYLPTTGSNIGIGTSTPVAGLSVMNGNVGIGTWSPTSRLQVIGTVSATAFVGDGSGLTGISANSGWTDGGAYVYTTTTTDSVGIGSTVPGAKLDIVGDVPQLRIASKTGQSTYLFLNKPDNFAEAGITYQTGGVDKWNIFSDNDFPDANDAGDLKIVGTIAGEDDGSPRVQLPLSSKDIYLALSGGNVGIGTTIPVAGLAVMNGNVGIGTWSPNSSLTIQAPTQSVSLFDIINDSNLKIFNISSNGHWGTLNLNNESGSPVVEMYSNLNQGPFLRVNAQTKSKPDGAAYDDGAGLSIRVPYTVGEENGIFFVNVNNVASGASPGGAITFYTSDTSDYGRGGLKFKTSSVGSTTTRLLIDPMGLIGINTTNPKSRLSINGGVGIGTLNSSAFINTTAPEGGLIVEKNVGIGTNVPVGALTVMNGNVGIGTWSPTSRLQVIGTVSATAFVGDGSGLTGISANSGWTDGGTNVYTSTITDNVGIGTTTPNAATVEIVKNAAQPILKVSSTATGNGDYLKIMSDGNVGIGTISNAGYDLNVVGDTGGQATIRLQSLQTNGMTGFDFYDSSGTFKGSLGYPNGAAGGALSTKTYLSSGVGTDLVLVTDDDFAGNYPNKITMKSGTGYVGIGTLDPLGGLVVMNGNVGIGTWNPGSGLNIIGGNVGIGTTTQYRRIAAPTNGMAVEGNVGIGTWAAANGKLIVMGGNVGIGTVIPVGAMVVMNGNVGMGSWSPTSRLQVIGTVNATAFVGDGSGLTNIAAGGWTDGGANIYLSATSDSVAVGTTTPLGGKLVVQGGNFGVGTLSPSSFIEVKPSVDNLRYFATRNAAGNITFSVDDNSGRSVLQMFDDSNNARLSSYGWAASGPALHLNASDDNKIDGAYTYQGLGLYLQVESAVGAENGIFFSNSPTGGQAGASITYYVVDTFSYGQGGLHFKTSNEGQPLTRMTIDQYGNIGVATLYPSSRLVVNGGVGIGTLNASSFITTTAPSGGLIVEKNVGIGTTSPVGALTVMNGNVGIGTWSPTSRLQVVGTVSATAFVGDGSGLTGISANSSGWTDGGTNVYTSATTDNVGIGTTTPNAATLEIVKNAAQPLLKISSTPTGSGNYLLINSQGNIGIGTLAPVGALTVMSGNVGIGSFSPQYILDVFGNTSDTMKVRGTLDSSDIVFFNASNVWGGAIGIANADNTYHVAAGPADMIFTTDNTISSWGIERMRIVQATGSVGIGTANPVGGTSVMNGNVGIGTWSPGSGLMIRRGNVGIGTTIPYLRIAAPPNGMAAEGNVGIGTWAAANGKLIVMGGNVGIGTTVPVGALTVMNGNVGIGTWSPNSKLQLYNDVSEVRLGYVTGGNVSAVYGIGGDCGGSYCAGVYSDTPSNPNAAAVGGYVALSNTNGIALFVTSGTVTTGRMGYFLHSGSAFTSDMLYANMAAGSGSFTGRFLHFQKNGATQFAVDANGNIGIGTLATSNGKFVTLSGNVGLGTTAPVGGLVVMTGNVGIGTWSPTRALQVVGTVSATSFVGDGSGLTGIAAGGWSDGGTNVYQVTTSDVVAIGTTTPLISGGAARAVTISKQQVIQRTDYHVNELGSDSSYVAVEHTSSVDYSGGLNVIVPGGDTVGGIHVAMGDAGTNSLAFSLIGLRMAGSSYNTSGASAVALADGEYLPGVAFAGQSDTTAGTGMVIGAAINGIVAGTVSSGVLPTDLTFRTSVTDSSGLTERMRITSSGNVGIGTSAPVGALTVMNGNVGIGTWAPTSGMQMRTSFAVYRGATAASATSAQQTIIGVTNTAAPRTITLATADAKTGRIIIIKDESGGASTNNITVTTEGGQTIDGAASVVISVNYGVLRVYSDGTNWFTF